MFQEFATLDLISDGRAEIMAGRGSFIESFPLFGYDLDDYDELFAEKLELLLDAARQRAGDLAGQASRADRQTCGVYPRPVQDPLPVWIAVGGTPQSVVRAGTLGLPMALAIIGGEPERFAPLVELYREAGTARRPRPGEAAVGINSHGYIAEIRSRRPTRPSRLRRGDEHGSAASAAGRRPRGRSSTPAGRSAAPISSAAPSRWSRRSCSSTSSSSTSAS